MRFIILESSVITQYTEKILYKEGLRIFNEHAIRLLVDNEINFQREIDEIQEFDK